MSRVISLALVLVVALFALATDAKTVKHESPDFELTMPSDFKEFPKGKADPDTLCSFVSYKRDILGRPIVVLVDRMGERIREHTFTDTDVTLGKAFSNLPPSAEMTALRGTWKDFEINIVRVRMIDDGEPITSFVAQVPLKSEAIMIAVAGDRGLEEQSRQVLDEVLAQLEGEGQWASRAEWYLKPRNLLIVGGAFVVMVGFKRLVSRD